MQTREHRPETEGPCDDHSLVDRFAHSIDLENVIRKIDRDAMPTTRQEFRILRKISKRLKEIFCFGFRYPVLNEASSVRLGSGLKFGSRHLSPPMLVLVPANTP